MVEVVRSVGEEGRGRRVYVIWRVSLYHIW